MKPFAKLHDSQSRDISFKIIYVSFVVALEESYEDTSSGNHKRLYNTLCKFICYFDIFHRMSENAVGTSEKVSPPKLRVHPLNTMNICLKCYDTVYV